MHGAGPIPPSSRVSSTFNGSTIMSVEVGLVRAMSVGSADGGLEIRALVEQVLLFRLYGIVDTLRETLMRLPITRRGGPFGPPKQGWSLRSETSSDRNSSQVSHHERRP